MAQMDPTLLKNYDDAGKKFKELSDHWINNRVTDLFS